MFIKATGGYNRHGQQFARGKFMAVFAHNSFKAEEQANPIVPGPCDIMRKCDKITGACSCAGNPEYYQESCPVHKGSYVRPSIDGRKLYGIVRHCNLQQLGHWMMGTIRIAGQSVTVSGAYGSNGLPMDYEDLTPAARAKVVELPKELCDEFWAGGGWNTCGVEASAMRRWAINTFKQSIK